MQKTIVETLCYYSRLFNTDRFWLQKKAQKDIQELLDSYCSKGFELVSTDAHQFGWATYIYLYFRETTPTSAAD